MAGGAVPQIIFFIGSVIAATGFIVIVNDNVALSGMSMQAAADEMSRELRGQVEVVHVNASSSDVYVYASNLGTLPVGINETLLLIDGEWVDITSIVILRSNGDSMWGPPPELLEIHGNKSLDDGWHNARILVKESISSPEYRFVK